MTDWFFSWLVRIRTILPLRPELGDLPNPQIKQIIMCFVHISVLAIFHSRPMIRVSSHFTFFSFFSVVSSQKKPPPIPPPLSPRIPWVPAPGFQWIAMSSIPQHLREWDQWKGLGMSGVFWDTSFGLRWCFIIFVCLHVIDIDDSCDLRVPRLYCETSMNQWDFNSIWFTLVLKTPVINTTTKPTSNFGWFIRPISGKSWWIITLGWPHCIETHWTEGWLKFNVVTFDPSIWFV